MNARPDSRLDALLANAREIGAKQERIRLLKLLRDAMPDMETLHDADRLRDIADAICRREVH